ncbi:hypothetical protein J6590_075754 [Homalodisca vitripennis]|nr:hypothetical protein J6590_075754 [Homalodisca vitripennis]
MKHIDRGSEIDRLLLRDSESESDDADPNLYSDRDTESEFDVDEVCEAGQHEEESDRNGGHSYNLTCHFGHNKATYLEKFEP